MPARDPALRLFLRFAVPCAFVLQQRGELSAALLRRLEAAAASWCIVRRSTVERIFRRAFARIDRVAQELGTTRWDPAAIRAYFVDRHNGIIDRCEDDYAHAPPALRALCRVERATVRRVRDGACVVALEDGRVRAALATLVPSVRAGDGVLVHYGYVVERTTRAAAKRPEKATTKAPARRRKDPSAC